MSFPLMRCFTFFWAVFLVFLAPVFLHAGDAAEKFSLVLEASSLDPVTQQKLVEFLAEAELSVPEKMKEAISRPIRIHFTELDAGTEIQVPCDAKKGAQYIYGATRWSFFSSRKNAADIDLHQAFIPVILQGRAGAATYACGHHSLYGLAMATLLHEVTHLYDFSEYRSPEEMREMQNCEESSTSFETMSSYCTRLFMRDGVVSGRLGYQQLMGWKESFSGLSDKNHLTFRSPDPYEFLDIAENFAVNMEYFLLDPEYACRRPAAQYFFVNHFGLDPFPKRTCHFNDQIVLSGSGILGSLDPARVYQVHYLFASKGQEWASNWGHAMLRLVVCAPERKTVDEQCLKDTEYHLVVSFRANVNDLVVDTFRGFFGGYPSQLFIYSLNGIVEEYARKEMRDLISLPLALSTEEKTQLVSRTAELYWGYSGKYYFITNNCATEAADLLRSVLPENHRLQEARILTPLGLYEELVDEKLADPSAIADQAQARKVGFFFASTRETLDSSLNVLIQKGVTEFSSLAEFFERTDAASRKALYLKLQLPAPGRDRRLTSAFYLLESQVRRGLAKMIDDRTAALILEPSPDVIALVERYKSPQFQMDPWLLVTPRSGYGVPLFPEMISRMDLGARKKEFIEFIKELYAKVADRLKNENDELAAVKDNLRFLSNELRF